ncbi:MAG: hybrid sensor histidine kinase/response regulator [Chloroflexota bacterium]|nr:hybrid sensor histidine kinase/response regulator [Chloroflexota bacterium]
MATRPEPTAIDASTGKPCVLLVEDEPTLSKLVGKLLDDAGYAHISIADHGQIADAIARHRPQCIILDSDPGSALHARSWADAAAIRRAHPAIPVLMFTADPAAMAEARAATTARSRAAGYADVIDKPFLVVEFLATLKHAVDVPQARLTDGKGSSAEAISVFPELSGAASTDWAAADFFAVAIHELRTPLTSIAGHAQLVQRFVTKDPTRAADSAERIREQAQRMNRLIGDLLDHARVSVGALSLEVVTFDLGVAVAHMIGLVEHDDPPRITLSTSAAARVRGDPDRIAQIVGNLLDNAAKYSPPGSPIDVSLTVVATEVQVRVTDRGGGVPDDDRDRIFAPFYRTARTREITGTGLGLHISRRIAEQNHGRLWLESSSGTGSTFVLALPIVPDASAA